MTRSTALPEYQRAKVAKLRRLEGQRALVDSAPVRTHVSYLHRRGLPLASIGDACGHSKTFVRNLIEGHHATIHRDSAEALAAVTLTPHPRQAVVLAVGLARRAHALAAIGWPMQDTAAELGMRSTNLTRLCASTLVRYWRWEQMRQLYDARSMTPGTSDRARQHAQRLRWPSPLAWDDDTIDDPDAGPCVRPSAAGNADSVDMGAVHAAMAGRVPYALLTRTERSVLVTRLWSRGASDGEIARRVSASARTILRARVLLGLPANPPR